MSENATNETTDLRDDLERDEDTVVFEDVAFDEIEEIDEDAADDLYAPDLLAGNPQDLVQKLQQLEERNQQLMRVAADFDNYRRRQEREREDLVSFAGQKIIESLLPVLDNFERALQAEVKPEDVANFVEGTRMIQKQFIDILQRAGVTLMDTVGTPFDPAFHEAIAVEDNDEHPDQTVLAEFQKGYLLNGRLVRPAIVKVSNAG